MSVSEADEFRTVNLDLGNAAEVNKVVINAASIAYVRFSGKASSRQRRMEINLANGEVISMNFEEPEHAQHIFGEVVASMNRTIPDQVGATGLE
jgi:hypothetical protein